VHVQDQIVLDPRWTAWAGLRHTALSRSAVRTDGSRPTDYRQDFTTPWLAVSYRVAGASDRAANRRDEAAPTTLLYASTGQGVESEVTPNRSRYVNAGEALPALKSRQVELGVRSLAPTWTARAAVFDIRRPAWNDIHIATGAVARDDCSDADPCLRRADGASRHRGLEAEVEWRKGPLSLRGSAMALRARREGSVDASLNGLRPTNVPAHSLKAQAAWNVRHVPGLTLLAFVVREGERIVLPDNSIATPGWTRWDLGARWSIRPKALPQPWVLRVGVDNVTDRRAWQEAPFQYGHAYLYPLAPRTWRASAEMRF
jgi:iron complex outermembrane receptor protein